MMNQPTLVTVAQRTVSPSFCLNRMNTLLDKDTVHWFPMRVTYNRQLLVKDFFDSMGVECFIPMRYEPIEGKHPRHQVLKPAINNLIFVHSSRANITEMKMTRRELAPLRYMMQPLLGADRYTERPIIVVPDKQMENFMRVASVTDNRVFYMDNLDFVGKPGQRVKIVEGEFSGVEGIVKRVKKNKVVVVQIEHVAAVAIAFLPSAFIVPLEEE